MIEDKRAVKNAKQREYRKMNGDIHTKRYEKTVSGFLMRLYRNMKSRVRGIQKGDKSYWRDKELVDKVAFYEWAENHPRFIELYEEYINSGYVRNLAPSVDRLDSSIGYTFSNMEWVSSRENCARSAKLRWSAA